jgi:hypothetical protein
VREERASECERKGGGGGEILKLPSVHVQLAVAKRCRWADEEEGGGAAAGRGGQEKEGLFMINSCVCKSSGRGGL